MSRSYRLEIPVYKPFRDPSDYTDKVRWHNCIYNKPRNGFSKSRYWKRYEAKQLRKEVKEYLTDFDKPLPLQKNNMIYHLY